MEKFNKGQKVVRAYECEKNIIIEYGTIVSAGKKQIKFEGKWYTRKFNVEWWGEEFFALENLDAAKEYASELSEKWNKKIKIYEA